MTVAVFSDQGTIRANYPTEGRAFRQPFYYRLVRRMSCLMINDDYEVIFVKWIRHRKTGKKIYPKNGKAFALRVRRKR